MGMGDNAGYGGDDHVLTPPGIFSDDESTESSDANKDDNISLISSKTNISAKTGVAKKRVQFLPDGFLVRVREIPPRSNKSSSESDGSVSDTDSEDSDSESATESDDVSSERDTPSPATPTESQNKFATMPPLMYTAKGSYAISKQNSAKSGNAAVAKITGIDPSIVPPSSPSSSSGRRSSFSKKSRRSPSPKFEKRPRRNSKTNIEKTNNNKRVTAVLKNENAPAKLNKKRMPLKVKEGKISPPPASSKQQKQNNNSLKPHNSVKLSQRRISSATEARTISPSKRSPKSSVSTSLTVLPTSSVATSSSSSFNSPSLDRVSRAMQSLTMGKLYTVDGGFIFPPHHTNDLHLPDLSQNSHVSKSDDFEISVSVSPSSNSPTQKRPSTDLGSPRRSYQESGTISHQTSPQSANRKRRHYAWQMANGSIQNTLHSTPSISQLWDNPGKGQSDSTEKFFSNSR